MTPKLIHSADDLVTSHEAIREGFLSYALAKTGKAAPYVEKTKQLWLMLQQVNDVDTLLNLTEIQNDLIAAAGFSEKARSHLSLSEINDALRRVLRALFEQVGSAFREEILYRYLLTMGDALGGQMRNFMGADAGTKLTAALLAALRHREVQIQKARKASEKIQRLDWPNRRLLFDVKPRLIGKNIDIIRVCIILQEY